MLRRFSGYGIGLTCCEEVYEKKIIKFISTYTYTKKPWPRPGLVFEKAKATSGQAKARAFRPSRARTALLVVQFGAAAEL